MEIIKTLITSLIVVGFNLFTSAIAIEPKLLDTSCKAEGKKATDDIALENKADNVASNRASTAKMSVIPAFAGMAKLKNFKN